MTKGQQIRIRLAAGILGGVALLVPVTVTGGGEAPVKTTEACAGESCCKELGSLCQKDGEDHLNFYEAKSCTVVTQN